MDRSADTPKVEPTTTPSTARSRSEAAELHVAAGPSRIVVFWLQIAYLIVLGAIAYLVGTGTIEVKDTFGPIPRAVPWFGALGGVLISLSGIFEHRKDWDPAYWPWHVSRPLVGVAVAAVAVLTLQSGVLAIGGSPPADATNAYLFYYVIAFVVGYREETFRQLIKRMADVLLQPAGAKPEASGGQTGTAAIAVSPAATTASEREPTTAEAREPLG